MAATKLHGMCASGSWRLFRIRMYGMHTLHEAAMGTWTGGTRQGSAVRGRALLEVLVEVLAAGDDQAAIPVVDGRGVPAVGEQAVSGVAHLRRSHASWARQ